MSSKTTASETAPFETTTFENFALHKTILRAVAENGYVTPTPIQQDAIPPALEGRDVLGCAMTGSGKTAAFVLPLLQQLSGRTRGQTRALILTPTRELAAQIQDQVDTLGKYTSVRAATVYGGVPMRPQQRAFEIGTDIIVATPGRLLDHFQYRYAKLGSLEFLVLDEADRMLDMGFLPAIRKVLAHISKPKQTLFFSATMPQEIVKLTQGLLHNPVRLNIERVAAPATGITQNTYPVPQKRKPAFLVALLAHNEIDSAIVFTRTKHRADKLSQYLVQHGLRSERIHGSRSQRQRTDALEGFKNGRFKILVATDIAARGIDIEALGHVINFDVPAIPEDYIHRVGRTARAERTGEAITLFCNEEEAQLRDIEKATSNKLPRLRLPGFDYSAPEEAPVARGAGQHQRPRTQQPRTQQQGQTAQHTKAQNPKTQASRTQHPNAHSGTQQDRRTAGPARGNNPAQASTAQPQRGESRGNQGASASRFKRRFRSRKPKV